MKTTFSINDLGIITEILGHNFFVHINKCGNIELTSKKNFAKFIFHGYDDGTYMIRRSQPTGGYSTVSSRWPLGRNTKTNVRKMFDTVPSMVSWFCGYLTRTNLAI